MSTHNFEIAKYCSAVAKLFPELIFSWDPCRDKLKASRTCYLPQQINSPSHKIVLTAPNIDRMITRDYTVTLSCVGCPLFRRWQAQESISEE